VICICDKKIYIDSYTRLPFADKPISDQFYTKKEDKEIKHVREQTWRKDKFAEMIA